MLVDGLGYLEIKHRLELVQPTTPGETTERQREWVGAEPIMADSRPRRGGWRQPTMLPAWTSSDGLDEYEEASDDTKIVLSVGTTRRLEAET